MRAQPTVKSDQSLPARSGSSPASPLLQVIRWIVLVLVFAMLALAGLLVWPILQARLQPSAAATLSQSPPPLTSLPGPSPSATPSPFATPSATASPASPPSNTPTNPEVASQPPPSSLQASLIVLAMDEGPDSHLFALPLDGQPLQRLTSGPWRDIQPAVSPDGSRVAFASNRSGFWDLYLMELASGAITRLTDTPTYEGAPSWSPDGLWLVYEAYVERPDGGDLELFIRPVDGSQEPIRLTFDPAADHDPRWSPQGRIIAFTSTHSGENEIWLADLDKPEERFFNVSQNRLAVDVHPAWSNDGSRLIWARTAADGVQTLVVWDLRHPENRPQPLQSGDYSAWHPSDRWVAASLQTPNQTYLTLYDAANGNLAYPILPLPGNLNGLSWGSRPLPPRLPEPLQAAAELTPTPVWSPVVNPDASLPGGRYLIVPLQQVQAPNPALHDRADEAFYALRQLVQQAAGWDFLASLEEAFVPFPLPLSPDLFEDWRYTGRAFRFNPAPLNAGWLVIVREDYGPQVYWRVYLRVRFQNGTQGQPLDTLPWSLEARLSGDPLAYERGGALAPSVPAGYWLDFTRLAAALGWKRQPALSSWIQAYSSARYNEFVLTEGRDWLSAMLEIYPRAMLDTPTPVPSPTKTPTITKTPTPTATPTRTPYLSPTPTVTPTRRPTSTPRPTNTPWPTRTPVPSKTPLPSPTPTYTPVTPI